MQLFHKKCNFFEFLHKKHKILNLKENNFHKKVTFSNFLRKKTQNLELKRK